MNGVTKPKILGSHLHQEGDKKQDKDNGEVKVLSNEPILNKPVIMSDECSLAHPSPAAPLAESLAAPNAAVPILIHTRISRSKNQIVRDAKKRLRNTPLKRPWSVRTLYKEVMGWTSHYCGQSWDIYDVLILSSAMFIILFLIGFSVWVTIIAHPNPRLGNRSRHSLGDVEGF